MRTFIATIFLLVLITLLGINSAYAKCDPAYAPYYMRQETGPGSILADLFFLPFVVATATAGSPTEIATPKRRTRGGAELTHGPGCMALFLAGHAIAQRPVHVEHYRY